MLQKMYKNIIVLCLVVSSFTKISAGTLMFENANQLYRSKQYVEASDLYMQIINDGYGSSSVYYNAGNAFFKSNKLGYAVWCYTKALQYQTDNKIIQDNLALTHKKLIGGKPVKNEFSFFKKVQELLNYFPLNKWAVYTWALFMVVLIFRALRLIDKAPLFLIGLRKLFFTIFVFSLLATMSNYFLNKFNKLAIVITNTVIYNAPSEEGLGHGALQEGTQVIIKNAEKDITTNKQKIKLPNGKICWVNKNSIRKL